ncbi:MAG: universal stress protein [Gammaproteobacteria bacterium]|nr:MAG: universal stress protein [Gammaproteobacteria bacterium SG8_31]
MRILVAVDFSSVTDRVMDIARDLATRTASHVYVLHVAEPEPDFVGYDVGPDVVRDQVAEEYHREHRQVQRLADSLRSSDVGATALLIQGSIVETIIREADRLDADLVVVGSHGHGAVFDLLVGSISEGLVRRSSRPVLVVPPASS